MEERKNMDVQLFQVCMCQLKMFVRNFIYHYCIQVQALQAAPSSKFYCKDISVCCIFNEHACMHACLGFSTSTI